MGLHSDSEIFEVLILFNGYVHRNNLSGSEN